MYRKKYWFLYVISCLIFLYLVITFIMYYSKDANFTSLYNDYCFFIIVTISIMTLVMLFYCNRGMKVLIITIFLAFLLAKVLISRVLFGNSIEHFLLQSNKKLYNEVVVKAINSNEKNFFELSGIYKKLAKVRSGHIKRDRDFVEIEFGVFCSGRSRIIFSSNMERSLKDWSAYKKYELIDKNWCILYH